MSGLAEKHVLEALQGIENPGGGNIVSRDMVRGVQIKDGHVLFSIEVNPADGAVLETLRQDAERAVAALPGVSQVTAVLTAERNSSPANDTPNDPHGMAKNPPLTLPIKNIIAVASGKGGVGKSTVAFNLAVALAQAGQSVGLLDADIYGPSVPVLSGICVKPEMKDGKLVPPEAHGLKLMSMGFMVDGDAPMIWRGPMVQTALYQMLRDVAWGADDTPLDVLVVDMPPGTGDAQLTLAQKVPVTGAVIVSTPQDLALVDARKAIEMFGKTNVSILGLIENMSTHICSACGHEDHIFGHGGAETEATKRGVPFLGAIPLRGDIREQSDKGQPVADIFDDIADRLISSLVD